MAKSKKKATPKKKVVAKKESIIKAKKENKPTEIKATPWHIEMPYIPRRIDRLPPDLNKLKK